jgi:hypothetical protein
MRVMNYAYSEPLMLFLVWDDVMTLLAQLLCTCTRTGTYTYCILVGRSLGFLDRVDLAKKCTPVSRHLDTFAVATRRHKYYELK